MSFNFEILSHEEIFFLNLLRGDYKKNHILLSTKKIDIEKLFLIAEDHYIPGMLCEYMIKQHRNDLESAHLAYCKVRVMSIINENRVKEELLAKASQILHNAEISVLAVKGPVLDRSDNHTRYYNDLDILIPEQELLRAVKLLKMKAIPTGGSDILSEKEKRDIPAQLKWIG